MWSAYTEAYAKKDVVWIKKTLHKMNLIVFVTFIIKYWIGDFGFIIFDVFLCNYFGLV